MNTLALPAFNPLRFANTLKAAGVADKHAEAEAEHCMRRWPSRRR